MKYDWDLFNWPTEDEMKTFVKEGFVASFAVYSGWLDDQGLLKKAKKRDGRTHWDLAEEFVESMELLD